MKLRKFQILNISILIMTFIVSVWAYTRLPDRVASHWDAVGHVNGYMSKFGGAFFVPILVTGIFFLLSIVPFIDPKKQNIKKFIGIFDGFITVFLLFMVYIYALTLIYNIWQPFELTSYMMPALGLLFFYIGWMLPQAEPNWFIGIRTPWTLSSDEVWKRTHILGGKLFKIAGILALIGVIFPRYAFLFVLVPVFASSLYVILYSYFVHRGLDK